MNRPNEWKQYRLRDITMETATWNPRTDMRHSIRYVDVSGVSREYLRIVSESNYPAGAAPSRARKIVQYGDTIFATIRPTLRRIAQVPESLNGEIVSTAFCVLRPDRNQIDPDFLFFAAQTGTVMSGIAALETGASYPAVRDSDILDQSILLPSLSEQRSIAAVLNRVRAALLQESECETAATALKNSAMRELFTHGLHGKARTTATTRTFPPTWTTGKLGAFAHFQRGFDITKAAQGIGEVPVISSGGVRSFHDKAAARGPGVLIGRKGSIGSLHYVDSDFWPHDTTLWCTDFQGNIPKFVFYLLHTLNLKKLDSGAANPALNRNFLHDEQVSWPNIDEQLEIVAILDSIEHKVELHRQKWSVLEELFEALLHKLMTCQIQINQLQLSALGPIGDIAA